MQFNCNETKEMSYIIVGELKFFKQHYDIYNNLDKAIVNYNINK